MQCAFWAGSVCQLHSALTGEELPGTTDAVAQVGRPTCDLINLSHLHCFSIAPSYVRRLHAAHLDAASTMAWWQYHALG